MFDWKKPTVEMLGRWQPWHDGHQKLFEESFDNLSNKILDIENKANNNQKNYEDILLTLSNLEKNLNELNFKSTDSKQKDAAPKNKISYQTSYFHSTTMD